MMTDTSPADDKRRKFRRSHERGVDAGLRVVLTGSFALAAFYLPTDELARLAQETYMDAVVVAIVGFALAKSIYHTNVLMEMDR